jgi:hypothetical protein
VLNIVFWNITSILSASTALFAVLPKLTERWIFELVVHAPISILPVVEAAAGF